VSEPDLSQPGTNARERDTHTIGLVFVGVLFAAVITKILELSSADGLPVAGAAHLVLAAVVTITSWIGYHNSANRSTYKIYFFNLPLALFVIEMIHVYLYWLIATTSENAVDPRPSAVPESLLVVAVFAAYTLWDQAALAIRRSPRYGNLPRSSEQPARRRVTVAATCLVVVLATGALTVDPTGTVGVVLLDAALCLVAIGHRAVQHRLGGAPEPGRAHGTDR